MTNYIGIDTGTRLLGWAMTDGDGKHIDSGWVDLETPLSKKLKGWDSLAVRLGFLGRCTSRLFAERERVLGADSAANDVLVGIEHPWVGKSKQTSLTLGMAWGIIAQAAMQCRLPIVKIEPTQAKKALTGSGLARKPAMLEAARNMGAKCEGKGKFDEADAFGVALATRLWDLERRRESL